MMMRFWRASKQKPLPSSRMNSCRISPTVSDQFKTSGKKIVSSLSFSHIVELLTLDDPLARYFYEQECIKCTWSVRELRRQISTNLYVSLPSSRMNSCRWLISASSKSCSSTTSCAFSPRNSNVNGWRICNSAESCP